MGRFVVEMDGAYFLSLLCAIFILGIYISSRFIAPEVNACNSYEDFVVNEWKVFEVDGVSVYVPADANEFFVDGFFKEKQNDRNI